MEIKLESKTVKLSVESNTLNRLRLSGTVCYLDKPSDGVPGGCDLPLVITSGAVNQSVETLQFMPINCNWEDQGWGAEFTMTDHGDTKIGVVTNGYIEGNEVKVDALIYSFDNPDVAYFIKNCVDSLGFSIEAMITKSHSDDSNVYADELTFTGVALLMKKCAAFKDTYISYIAAKNKNIKSEVNNNMNEEQMKALLEGFMGQVTASIEGIKTELSAQVEKANSQVETLAVSLAETKAKVEEAKVAPVVVEASVKPDEVIDQPSRVTAANAKVTEAKLAESNDEVTKIWAGASKDNQEWFDRFSKTIECAKKDMVSKKLV